MVGHSLATPESEAGSEDKAVARAVEEQLGTTLADVAVHRGPLAQELSEGLGARAFTTGRDVYVGDGHGRSESQVLAHELVHVAQQRSTGPRVQRSAVDGSGGPEEAEADAVAEQVAGAFVVDGSPRPGQREVREFLAEMERRVTEVASRELGPMWSAAGCPYIAGFFAKHRDSGAATIDRLARRYSGVSAPASADDYVEPILTRVGAAVRTWRFGNDVSDHLRVLGMAPLEPAVRDAATRAAEHVHRKAEAGREEAPVQEVAEAEHLAPDPGRPLPAGVQRRMSSAFGTDFSAVRVHDGGDAGRRAAALRSRAFTVGTDVTFGTGQFQPGTLAGDALLAHELAHVVQQGGGALAAPTHGGEEAQADHAAASALMHLDARAAYGVEAGAAPTTLPATRGLRLQRCGESTPSELGAADRDGQWEGKAVGYHRGDRKKHPLWATETVGFAEDEDAAIALATAAGQSGGAITLEDGEYVAYRVILPNYMEPRDYLTVEPGVLALVGPAGFVLRPTSTTPEERRVAVETLRVEEDPVKGYRDAFFTKDGKPVPLSDNDLLRAFDSALKQVALNTLARSHQEVSKQQKHLGGGTKTVSPGEVAHIRSTITALVPIAKETEAKQKDLDLKNMGMAHAAQGATQEYMDKLRKDADAVRADLEVLRARRAAETAKYPLLARYVTSSELRELGESADEALVSKLGGQTPAILESIADTAVNVSKDRLDLWELKGLVEQTIAELGITDAEQRKRLLEHQKERAKRKTFTSIATAVFTIGLAIGGALATGGLSLVLSAGAFGLGFYDAVKTTQDFLVQKGASNTELDPANSLLSPEEAMGWGWLVVAWAGVLLDAGDVVRAGGQFAKAAELARGVKSVAQGQDIGKAADNLVREIGLTGDEAANASRRLRVAAGELDAGTKISFATMAVAERRLGTTIEIAADLPPDAVRVMYKIDDLGNITVTGARVGTQATVADIVAHAGVVKMLRRYDGVLGRLRQVWDKLQSLVGAGGIGSLKKGSAAWESYLEMSKYQRILSARKARLGTKGISAAEESALKADIDFFEQELKHHEAVVKQMSFEAGVDFIASSGQSTKNALAKGYALPNPKSADGMPPITAKMVEADPKLAVDNPYYYRLVGKKHPDGSVVEEYVLVRKAGHPGPSLRGLPNGTFQTGELTRAERAAQLMAKWPEETQRAAFQALEEIVEKADGRLIPLGGISRRPGTMADVLKGAPADFDTTFVRLITESHQAFGKAADVALKEAQDALAAFKSAKLTIVQGTKDLRSFGYRAKYAQKTGQVLTEETELHHVIPLYLGGDHSITNLAKLPEKQHQEMHRLLESIKLDESTTLAPHSVLAVKGTEPGVAIIDTSGKIEFLTLTEMVERVTPKKTPTP